MILEAKEESTKLRIIKHVLDDYVRAEQRRNSQLVQSALSKIMESPGII